MFPVIGRRLLMRYRWTLCDVPAAQYARGARSRWHEKNDQSNSKFDLEDLEGYQLTEMHEEMEDFDKFREAEDFSKDKRGMQKKIAFKTIEHKFFRPPQEINLLTWDAKEQIRYLHQEFPDEWTLEKLSESFPISIEGIQRLLKSDFQPRTIADVVRHDQRVHKAWKKLKATEKGTLTDGPIVNRYKQLMENSQLNLLGNASGNVLLPSPNWKKQLLSSKVIEERKPGKYESIVAEYCKLKALKDELVHSMSMNEEQERVLADHLLSNKIYLESITKKPASKEKFKKDNTNSRRKQHSTESVIPEPNNLPRTKLYMDHAEDNNVEGFFDIESRDGKALEMQKEMESNSTFHYHYQSNNFAGNTDLKYQSSVPAVQDNLPLPISGNTETLSIEDQIRMGMDGTKKLPANDTGLHQSRFQKVKNTTDAHISEQEIQKLQEENISWHTKSRDKKWIETDMAQNNLSYGELNDAGGAEPYIYDQDKGYQFPYGQRKHLPRERINVPKAKKRSNNETVTYQSGKDVYDEDGEFLYRIS